jgi:hypothetical protein
MHDDQERSLAADSLEIDEVRDCETGEILCTKDVIGSDKERILQLRMALQQGLSRGSPCCSARSALCQCISSR